MEEIARRKVILALNLLKKLILALPNKYDPWKKSLIKALELTSNYIGKGDVFLSYTTLRISLELAIQLNYVIWKSIKERKDAIDILKDLSRKGKSFSLKMIKSVPGLAGVYRKQIAKTYIKVAEYVHPSYNMLMRFHEREMNEKDFHTFRDVIDFIMLIISHHVPYIPFTAEELMSISTTGLHRSYKYILKVFAKGQKQTKELS
ncbi:MAG: hypothetical protein DRJ66_03920 [Thermoprotei archaeon]|nr:MAG: hypothetical protein DRJ66_03920 [Thermoprotei archaeon]